MHTLFLNLASHEGLLACCTKKEVSSSRTVDHRIGDHELVPLFEQVLQEAKWTYNNLTHIACVTGPGGFTSIRVAVTAANVLADQLQIPCAGIHLSDLYRVRSADPQTLWFHSTKKDQLFVRGGLWLEPTLVTLEDFESRITNHESRIPKTWMGELIPEHRSIIDRLGMIPAPLKELSTVLAGFLANISYEKKSLEPWYGRGW